MMFLLGRQAILGHDPPMYLRSITATRCPCPAKVQAAMVPPVPPPSITRSYSSAVICRANWAEAVSCIGSYQLVALGLAESAGRSHPLDILFQQIEGYREENQVFHQKGDIPLHGRKSACVRIPAVRDERNDGNGHNKGQAGTCRP